MNRWLMRLPLIWPALLVLVGDVYALTHYHVSCLIAPQWTGRSLGIAALLVANLVLLGSMAWQIVRMRGVSRRTRRLRRLDGAVRTRLAMPELERVDVRIVEHDAPMLFTVGALRSVVVVSRWMLENLEEPELRAAFAHELAHVQHRDGLVMLLLRGLCLGGFGLGFFRRRLDEVAREFELRADALAASRVADPLAVASALVKVGRGVQTWAPAMAFADSPSLLQARVVALLGDAPRPFAPHSREVLWLTLAGGASLATWLTFIGHLCVRGLG
jgi:Zn-dependent protease with chaperone function